MERVIQGLEEMHSRKREEQTQKSWCGAEPGSAASRVPGALEGAGAAGSEERSRIAACCFVAQLCPVLRDPMDCSLQAPPSVGTLQARILEWVAMSSSRRCS